MAGGGQNGASASQNIVKETRMVAICLFIALAQFQYGYDSASISGLQTMPGFLMYFGYKDVGLLYRGHIPF
jgi:hypothetical protein